MSIDRTTPLTGRALREMLARQDDARMSLACENLYLTVQEESVFAEMARLGLSYDARIEYLKAISPNRCLRLLRNERSLRLSRHHHPHQQSRSPHTRSIRPV